MIRSRLVSRAALALVLTAGPLVALPAPAAARPAPDVRLFDQVWGTFKRRFYDRKFHGVDWDAMRERYRPKARAAKTREQLFAVINAMIGELKASHCVLVEGEIFRDHFQPEFMGRKTLRSGFELERHAGKYFVYRLYQASPVARAGLRVGDEVLTVDGRPTGESPDLLDAGSDPGLPGEPHFLVRVHDGREQVLTIRRRPDAAPQTIRYLPAPISMVDASRQSVRVIDVQGWKLGYIHLWHFMSPRMNAILGQALAGPLADVDGLLLDIRGRGGSPAVMNAVFARFAKGRYGKPVVCLVDEGSRSAKDVFAFNWKRQGVGPLVGRRTAGAVLGSTFLRMRDDAYLMIAIINVDSLSAGVRLEGRGVEPDEVVPGHTRYSAGKDAIVERGVELLMKRVSRTY